MQNWIESAQNLFGIRLSTEQLNAFGLYERELIAWNGKFNLTAIRDVDGIRTKHFLDGASCVLAWKNSSPQSLIDVGTGAGFPGLVLKILYPEMKLTLADSVGKKITFCKHMVDALNLKNVDCIHARAEDIGQDKYHREKYDWAVARAVANMSILAEYLLPLVKLSGKMLAQKGESAPLETKTAEAAIKLLGGKTREIIPVNLPEINDARYLVVVDKIKSTPPQYPRKAGMVEKKPLL